MVDQRPTPCQRHAWPCLLRSQSSSGAPGVTHTASESNPRTSQRLKGPCWLPNTYDGSAPHYNIHGSANMFRHAVPSQGPLPPLFPRVPAAGVNAAAAAAALAAYQQRWTPNAQPMMPLAGLAGPRIAPPARRVSYS